MEALVAIGLMALFLGPLVAFFLNSMQKYNELVRKFEVSNLRLDTITGTYRDNIRRLEEDMDELRTDLESTRDWEKKLRDAEEHAQAYLNKVHL